MVAAAEEIGRHLGASRVGYGTMDELMEALTLIQTGKATVMPIVLIDAPGGDYWQQVLYFYYIPQ